MAQRPPTLLSFAKDPVREADKYRDLLNQTRPLPPANKLARSRSGLSKSATSSTFEILQVLQNGLGTYVLISLVEIWQILQKGFGTYILIPLLKRCRYCKRDLAQTCSSPRGLLSRSECCMQYIACSLRCPERVLQSFRLVLDRNI